jgi:hypothetical protein
MTPKERVNRFFKREPIDTMPCFSGMGMVTFGFRKYTRPPKTWPVRP